MKEGRKGLILWIFGINLFISTFTFGGGYVVVPMIRKYFVQKKKLFSEEELMDMAAVAQSAPGAIAVNLSALSGYRTAGIFGALSGCTAAVIPPLVILAVISGFYVEFSQNRIVAAVLLGMQAGAAALIVDITAQMCRMIAEKRQPLFILMIPASFAANFIFHINVALILLTGCAVCVIWMYFRKKREGGKEDGSSASEEIL